MSLALGKLTLLVGAGILGSILAKEGRLPSVSDVVSGALKIALKPIKQNDSAPSTSKPRNDALMAQVNSLRQELQLLASSGSVTIVTSSAKAGRRYGIIIVIVVIGYGYVRWKGWKLPGFMFATRRSLSDACDSIAKQLEQVYSSISVTKKDLSSKLDVSSHKYDEIVACSTTTKDEVSEVRGEVSKFTVDIQSVSHKLRTLESRMGKIQDKQDETTEGVGRLILCTLNAENTDLIQDSPSSVLRPALEHPHIATSSRTVSLPPVLSLEPPSPSTSNGSSTEVKKPIRHAISATGLKECQGISGAVDDVASPSVSNGNHAPENTVKPPSPVLPQRQPSPGFLSRTFSATQYFKFK